MKSSINLLVTIALLTCLRNATAQSGSLWVTLAPQQAAGGGALWQVDGGSWNSSGTEVSLPTGSHTVTFNTINGWTSPNSTNVLVNYNQVTAVTGTYVENFGYLNVNIGPAGAVNAGAEWQVDEGAWQTNGAIVTVYGILGYHLVSYKSINGWITPSSTNVFVNYNQTTTVSGVYGTEYGYLQVNLSPAGAINAGAEWQVDGSYWQTNGKVVYLPIGSHTVAFNSIYGWTTPATFVVTVNNNETTSTNGVYVQNQYGYLQVNLTPQDAVSAGVQWECENGFWNNSGTVLELPVGSYAVYFTSLSSWASPATQFVTVTNNETTTITGAYIAQFGYLVVFTSLTQAQWALVNESGWENSGTVLQLPLTNFTVEFKPMRGWVTPVSQNILIGSDQATIITGTYLPILTITNSGNSTIVLWPSSATNWTLQQNSSLTTTNWSTSTGVSNDGTNISLIVNPSNGSLFFRLSHP